MVSRRCWISWMHPFLQTSPYHQCNSQRNRSLLCDDHRLRLNGYPLAQRLCFIHPSRINSRSVDDFLFRPQDPFSLQCTLIRMRQLWQEIDLLSIVSLAIDLGPQHPPSPVHHRCCRQIPTATTDHLVPVRHGRHHEPCPISCAHGVQGTLSNHWFL